MSLEQPEAEIMSDTSLNVEDQEELEKALTLLTLPLDKNEAVTELHHSGLREPMSFMETIEKVNELNKAALQLSQSFQQSGDILQIENSVQLWRQAVELIPNGHADKPVLLTNLGYAYQLQFGHLGDLGDIENAIAALKQAIELTPDGHARKPQQLCNLGSAYEAQFNHLGELNDIESAIVALKQAIELTPDGHAEKPARLSNLGSAYWSRFNSLGELNDIESAMVTLKQAVELTPDSNVNKPSLLNNLGTAYRSRFSHLGELSDIKSAIVALKQAIELTPDGHAEKPARLSNLGTAYLSRFDHLGELNDIEDAIVALKQAVKLTPNSHVHKPPQLSNLGIAYHSRFSHLGELTDIESAIVALKQAIELTPNGHAKKSGWLSNLGNAYQARFCYLGELSDIEIAIMTLKQAVKLTPDGHADKPPQLSSLGSAYQCRFNYLGELGDIKNAIVALKQAVKLTPDGLANKPGRLNNLGNAYQSQFSHLWELSDVESAIVAQTQAVELTPDGHADKPGYLSNLGNSYWSRFGHLRELSDIEKTIIAQKQAVELTPAGHADKPGFLSHLGNAYWSRFCLLGELSDIESAIVMSKQAVELTPDGHADKPRWLRNLGNGYQSQYDHSHNKVDLDSALSAFQTASLLPSGKPHVQLDAAVKWSRLCSTPALAVQAYTRFFELIPQIVWLGQTVSHRYKELPNIGKVIGEAAATAISAGILPLAVEWLDEGRSINWGQILQLRSALDDLHHRHPQIAKELEMVARVLQNAGTSTKNNSDPVVSGIKQAAVEEEAQKHRRMAVRYDKLVEQIRGLDGFTSFLKPKKLSELASAAAHGPVIIVNVDERRCDALILCSSGAIIHVPLRTFSLKQAHQLHLKLLSSLHTNGVRFDRNGDRATRPASGDNDDHFALILKVLWLNVVQPILSKIEDVLFESAEDIIPHITWCPTGPLTLLPLHAAGIYGGPTERNINISDFVVSSYTTTLRALISSVPEFKQHQAKVPTVLIISQPNTPGLSPLPGTVEEARVIQKYSSNAHTCHLNHDAATAEAVMHEMSKYDFIHFACHGIQDTQDPLDSAFALYDQRLKLKTLMSLSLSNVQLAVLSACQTATGDENLPEEAVHLAAGMLAVGYPSVIATLWSIGDKEAPIIADKVYANLLGHSGQKKSKMTPAYALHEATKNLRKEVGETNFVKWVPFIHLGV
ncbi:TPR-like protein [Gymnopus androsaceus JB14]|uniref:TPR-like protein n=1 Tax=Gymnopus androsaceus JB14 TaxID=1447944 RepID=A0A6A4IBQ6_9AGAR|nr:TPR-like protein [Gymnopus androsaceus JB14]